MTAGSGKRVWIAGALVPLLGFALPLRGQSPPAPGSVGLVLISSSAIRERALAAPPLPSSGDIVREIDDPASGQRWMLVRDDAHPGGPGRLLAAGGGRDVTIAAAAAANRLSRVPIRIQAEADLPVIRSGDRVRVEEHSATVDTCLEAVALTPAWAGSAFNARLSIGGRVVRAQAIAPGRAVFLAEGREKTEESR